MANDFGNILRANLIFGQIVLNLLLLKFKDNKPILFVENGQILGNNLAIWLHWSNDLANLLDPPSVIFLTF